MLKILAALVFVLPVSKLGGKFTVLLVNLKKLEHNQRITIRYRRNYCDIIFFTCC